MIKQINQVKEFHEAFKVNNGKYPQVISGEDVMLRCELLSEELREYEEAAMEEDLVEIADALGDQLYIVLGSILRHGLQDKIVEVFDEIHRSNMSKLNEAGEAIINGDNGHDPKKPIGKILKSEQYSEPDIKKILQQWL